MFGMLESLTKAAVSVAVTPVTAVLGVVAMPLDAVNENPLCGRTQKAASNAFKNLEDATWPRSEKR